MPSRLSAVGDGDSSRRGLMFVGPFVGFRVGQSDGNRAPLVSLRVGSPDGGEFYCWFPSDAEFMSEVSRLSPGEMVAVGVVTYAKRHPDRGLYVSYRASSVRSVVPSVSPVPSEAVPA